MKKTIVFAALAAALLFLGCATPGADVGPSDGSGLARELTANVRGPESGTSSAKTTTNEIPAAPAIAWGASTAESTSTTAKYSPTNTNSTSGHLVTGFVLGANAAERTELMQNISDLVADDVVLTSIAQELAALMAVPADAPPDPMRTERIDRLREAYAIARDSLVASLQASGSTGDLNLANLQTLVVVGIIGNATGAPERAPTDEEIRRLGLIIPNAINAAKGQTQILAEDDRAEGDGS